MQEDRMRYRAASLVLSFFFLACCYDLNGVPRPDLAQDSRRDGPADATPDGPAAEAGTDSGRDGPVPDKAVDAVVKPDSAPPPPKQICSKDNWCWVNSLPQGNTLRGIFGFGATSVFAVGGAGTVMRFDGIKWSAGTSGTSKVLHDVWGAGAKQVHAAGDQGTIVTWDGAKWTKEIPPVTATLRGIFGSGAKHVFAVGDQGTIVHFNGTTWTDKTLKTLKKPSSFYDVWGEGTGFAVAVGEKGRVATYDGSVWSAGLYKTATLYGVWGTSKTNFFVVGDGGTLGHFTAMGFSPVTTGTTEPLRHVWGSSGSDVYVFGDKGAMLHFNGKKWSKVTGHGATAGLRAAWGSGASDLHVVGEGGAMLRFDGNKWSTTGESATSSTVHGVWASGSTDVHAVSEGGEILRYDGNKWSKQTLKDHKLRSVWGLGPSNAWAGGMAPNKYGLLKPRVYRFDGKGWADISTGLTGTSPSPVAAIWGFGPTDVWGMVPGATYEYLFRFDGTKWDKSCSSYQNKDMWGVWGSSAIDVYTIDEVAGLKHYNGIGWDKGTKLAGDYRWIWGSDATNIFLVGLKGVVARYDGKYLTAMTSNTTRDLWAAWGTGPTNVYAVGAGGAIVRYDGSAWKPMVSGCEHDLRAVWGTKAGQVYVVGDHGAVLRRTP